MHVIGGDGSVEANWGHVLSVDGRGLTSREQKHLIESYSNRQERAEAIVRELQQSSRESRSNR